MPFKGAVDGSSRKKPEKAPSESAGGAAASNEELRCAGIMLHTHSHRDRDER